MPQPTTVAWQVIRVRDSAVLGTYTTRQPAEDHGSRLMRDHINEPDTTFRWDCFDCMSSDDSCLNCIDGNEPKSLHPLKVFSYVPAQEEYGYEIRTLPIHDEVLPE